MSYQALARKYRPNSFDEVVGQQHILNSMIHALDNDKLHHAYLFTGTRGVGKTSLARLFAKCLNCEAGVSSKPCGQCQTCKSFEEGTFIDLIEIDAASRTRVEDTKEILDNVQYMPTQGRYKIYLIDEVHMLSNHSFNALLKTLEEPPGHVKFLLATTDPQKLPITVLSRCLQLHLKNLSREEILNQIKIILASENIPYEESAIIMIANAANGSMRDALSILDQAIAYTNENVDNNKVSIMLGIISADVIQDLVNAILAKDIKAIMPITDKLLCDGKDASQLLSLLAQFWYTASIYQFSSINPVIFDKNLLKKVAAEIHPQQLQLFYQITIKSQEEINLAPDDKIGLNMAFIRMLAFFKVENNFKNTKKDSNLDISEDKALQFKHLEQNNAPAQKKTLPKKDVNKDEWIEIVKKMTLKGPARQVVLNSIVHENDGSHITLIIQDSVRSLLTPQLKEKINSELNSILQNKIQLSFVTKADLKESDVGENKAKKKILTPAEQNSLAKANKLEQIFQDLSKQESIQILCKEFNTSLHKENIFLKH